MNSSTSCSAVSVEGNTGYMGTFEVIILSSSNPYTRLIGNNPGVPKITTIPSISGKLSLMKSMMIPNCSAVPVARKSIGLATADPGNNFSFNFSITGPSSKGTSRPPEERVSVSITAGPPACVITAIFLPFNSGCINIEATVIISSRPSHSDTVQKRLSHLRMIMLKIKKFLEKQ